MADSVPLRSIAAEIGVHFTTVSRALQDSPKVSAKTKKKILSLAAARGYKPDPLVSALSSYRSKSSQPAYHGVIGWLNAYPKSEELYHWGLAPEYYAGASEKARSLGYELQEFWLNDPALEGERLDRVLRARGVNGVIVAPMPEPGMELNIDLRELSAITFGYSLRSPVLHTVTTDGFRGIKTMFRNLRALGHRRIGFLWHRQFEERSHDIWLGGYMSENGVSV